MKHNTDMPMVRPQSRFVSPNEPPVVMRSGRLDDIPDVGKAASPVRMMVVAAILVVAGCVVAVFALQQVGIPWWGTSIVAVALFFWLGKWILVVLNGDYIAARRISANEAVERAAIAAQKDIADMHYATTQMEIESNERLEAARIAAQTELGRMRHDVSWLVDTVSGLQRMLTSQATAPAHTYVPATTEPAKRACEAWLMTQWDETGERTTVDCRFKAPWNTEDWAGQPWADEAKGMLLGRGILAKQGTGWAIQVESISQAMEALQ